ncbi:MAG: proprotein convertase P-domain-containing protein [Phycisphaerae bacterium]|nr:proprotein convertase P-domain-containing protein [Phycisphaerae bacterium]
MRFRILCVAGALALVTIARATTFTNNTPITIVDNNKASVYPSVVNVPGSVIIQNVSVVLNGVTHPRLGDVSILLVSPAGKKIQLMAGTAGGSLTNLQAFLFSDAGRPITADPFQKVAYRPTVLPSPQAMQSPAPGLPYASSFESLIGDDGIGNWSLFIQDNLTGQAGSLSDGWSLVLNSSPVITPAHSEFVYQGVLKSANVPLSGIYDVQLDLWRNPTSVSAIDKVGSVTSFGVAVENGVFTTRFAPQESVLTAGNALFAEISVRGPGEGAFTKLSPREPISAVPLATYAIFAEEAEFASTAGSIGWGGITGVPPNVENAFSPWAATPSNGINNTNTGNVLIGTNSGSSKLTVNGTIESLTGGVKFPDDTVQTTAVTQLVMGGTTVSVNFSSLAAGAEGASTINFAPGSFLATDVVVVNPTSDLPADVAISYARVLNATQIRFVIRNHGTVAVDPPLTGFSFRVIR